ncbi:MAG: chromosomal replication initiator protein DnaA [Rickettsiaceae bacterium]|jgi:chromosomal replication initiator protein|uniref:chromosomal replication initiator protein DnaA n=1 Tax=Candidatus Megaera polyxenophila TaxID=988779 RepID=UPI001B746D78|nr:chromosomal replication initiator protein DnaA [Rickettsiaceae bacterium]MBU6184383.1 chromosomal replication initiator protein DnaA [Rickettsiales bacterium]WHA06614.1 chromosomal replication initiator protein DnaA [Candidatus Megaera polyxenophila]BBB56029.1 chromosomal replication initiator protein DnaA [Candidatus Megaera polyxenophila]
MKQLEQLEIISKPNNQHNENPHNLWDEVSRDLISHYGHALYKNWFSKIAFYERTKNNKLLLAAPSNFVRDWIKSNYFETIIKLVAHYDPEVKSVDIITKELNNFYAIGSQELQEPIKNEVKNPINLETEDDALAFLDQRFTFENFVIGPPNELAYAAALAVAESKTAVAKSNPLFLYGGVGLGKTHLMHAIAWHSKKVNPKRKVLYLSAEKFMYRFIKALRNKDVMAFKEEFRSVDVLMIDDIQFICGKDSTQEEFFHTFNAIIDNNKQMVISCDRSPSDLDNIEDRIKSRLGWGLVADVHSTTYELRVGILESKLEQMNINISQNVINFLAAKITSNVRELEGALNKVIAHSTLIGREVTLESTQDILRDLLRSNERIITIEDIQKRVANHYNIKISEMSSVRRARTVVRPRQIAMYLSKILTPKSLADIGSKFGKKDHTTVIHAVKKVEQLMAEDADVREEVNLLTRMLQN